MQQQSSKDKVADHLLQFSLSAGHRQLVRLLSKCCLLLSLFVQLFPFGLSRRPAGVACCTAYRSVSLVLPFRAHFLPRSAIGEDDVYIFIQWLSRKTPETVFTFTVSLSRSAQKVVPSAEFPFVILRVLECRASFVSDRPLLCVIARSPVYIQRSRMNGPIL